MVTRLVTGQNIAIDSNSAYRLELVLPGWLWGAVVFKHNERPYHLANEDGLSTSEQQLLINFHDTDQELEKILVFIWQPESGQKNASHIRAELIELLTGKCHANIDFDAVEHQEQALLLLEIYQRNQVWKIRCIRQGFVDGVDKLLASYGLLLNRVPAGDSPEHGQAESQQRSSNPSSQDGLRPDQSMGEMVSGTEAYINMTWQSDADRHHSARLYMGEGYNPISDLRLGCFYQLHNGQVGFVQSGMDMDGSFDGVPYIQSNRSTSKHFEQLHINTRYRHKLHRYLIYGAILEGYDHWEGLNVAVDFNLPGVSRTTLSPKTMMVKPIYAIAMIQFTKELIELKPLNEYFHHFPEMDHAFGWGLPWRHQD